MGILNKLRQSSGMRPQPGTSKGEYTCKMHSEVHLDKPGKCPKCGMRLMKLDKADDKGTKPAAADDKGGMYEY